MEDKEKLIEVRCTNCKKLFFKADMTPEELQALEKTLGEQTAKQIEKASNEFDAKMKPLMEKVKEQEGFLTEKQANVWKAEYTKMMGEIKEAAEKQGTTLAEMALKIGNSNKTNIKSISEQLEEDAEAIKSIANQKMGGKMYMLNVLGEKATLIPIKEASKFIQKAAGPIATIDGIGAGNVSSVTQAFDSATLIRLGLGAPVFNQYRNTTWLFDLINLINGTYDANSAFAIWFDEVPYDGGAATVPEGSPKPATQYKFQLNSKSYKKKATVLQITEEFSIDFALLQNNILNIGRVDVLNRVNDDILADIIANASAYTDGANFKGAIGVQNANDYDAIAALAAQVDKTTFGNVVSNSAIMSTTKKYRMGLIKNTLDSYLNPPAVLNGISFVGNPSVAADQLIVGDLKQYQTLLRGGMIVRIGYNGTDFAENKFSIVMEQYYMNWIATARKPAIVQETFANVKSAITE